MRKAEDGVNVLSDPALVEEGLRLMRVFSGLKDPEARQSLIKIAEDMAASDGHPQDMSHKNAGLVAIR